MDYVLLGKRTREYRLKAGLTQEALAERAGISASFLGHIERGSRKLSMETFVALYIALGATPTHLMIDFISFGLFSAHPQYVQVMDCVSILLGIITEERVSADQIMEALQTKVTLSQSDTLIVQWRKGNERSLCTVPTE